MTSRFSSSTTTFSVASSRGKPSTSSRSAGMSTGGMSTVGTSSAGMSSGGMRSSGMSSAGTSTGGMSSSGLSSAGISSGGMSTGGMSSTAMSSGGMSTGGMSSAGMSTGGMNTSGMSNARTSTRGSAGMSSGGMSTGGMSSGGMSTGGMSTGGMSSAGMSTGGISTGSMSSAGVSSGGMSTGGMSSAGMSTGGMSTGGMSSAGMSTGGISTGSMSSAVVSSGGMSTGGISSAGAPKFSTSEITAKKVPAASAATAGKPDAAAKRTAAPMLPNSKPKPRIAPVRPKLLRSYNTPPMEMQMLQAMRTREPERVRQLMHRGNVLQALTEQGNLREIKAALKGFRQGELLSWFVVRMFKTAFQRGHVDILFFMMHEGFDFAHVGVRNTLHDAAYSGEYNFRCVDLVIRAGMDVNYMQRPTYFTPLHVACLHKRMDLVQLFVHHKADVNAVSQDNATPIVCAERLVSDETSAALSKKIILYLQSKGARRDWRKTPKPEPELVEKAEYVTCAMAGFSASDDDEADDEEDVSPPKPLVHTSSVPAVRPSVGVSCSSSGARVDVGSSPGTETASASASSASASSASASSVSAASPAPGTASSTKSAPSAPAGGFTPSQHAAAMAAVKGSKQLAGDIAHDMSTAKTIMADTRLMQSLKSMGIGIDSLVFADHSKTKPADSAPDGKSVGTADTAAAAADETDESSAVEKDTMVVGEFWT